MIYFDDVFYKTYKDTGKTVIIVDREGNELAGTIVDTDTGRRFFIDDVSICYSTIVWNKTELDQSEYATHYIHSKHVEFAKSVALREDIRNNLLNNIVSYARYFEYYRGTEGEFTIYAIDNYDLRQENHSSIIGKFVERDDRLEGFKEHKLQGIAPSLDNNERVISTTVEAWRYRALDWKVIREICPVFVERVLDGSRP